MRSAILFASLAFVSSWVNANTASISVASGKDVLFLDDKLKEAIGIETLGGVLTPLLTPDCKLPCSVSQIFSTAEDGQEQITVHLFSGGAKMTRDAHPLGTFKIEGIAAMPRGTPKIQIDFKVDRSGVSLTATDASGKSHLSFVRVAP